MTFVRLKTKINVKNFIKTRITQCYVDKFHICRSRKIFIR